MNQILLLAPRWRDRVVLVAERRLLDHNEVVITAKDAKGELYFPAPMYITGERARQFPLEQMKTKAGGTIAVRCVPLTEMEKEVIVL